MKYINKLILSLSLAIIFNFSLNGQNIQIDITSDDITSVTVAYTATADYSNPPFNLWNGQLFTLKWPVALGSGLISSVTGGDFPFTLDGSPVEDSGFFYQKVSANVTNFSLPFTSGQTRTVATIELNDNDMDPSSTLEIADPTDPWAMGNNGVPAVVNVLANQFQGFVNSSATILPIELYGFTTTKDKKQVILDWTTASEINGSHFEVQRSRNLDTWTTIGTVDAVGESTTEQNYSLIDSNLPLSARGASKVFYYRLNMVDNDGSQEYSDVRSVRFDQDGEASFIVYPNPSVNEVFVNLSSITDETGPATMNIVNLQGQLVKSVTLPSNDDINVDVSTIQSGVYFFMVSQGEKLYSQKVIKLD